MTEYVLSKPVPFSCSVREHEQLIVTANAKHISRTRLIRWCLRYGLAHIDEVIKYNRGINDSQM